MRKRCHRIHYGVAETVYAILLEYGLATKVDGARMFAMEVSVLGHKQFDLRHAGFAGLFLNDASAVFPRISTEHQGDADVVASVAAANARILTLLADHAANSTK